MISIEGSGTPFGIDCKRFYVGGVKLSSKCPKCGCVDVRDLDDGYLSYPDANQVFAYDFYCDPCGIGWKENIILRVTVEAAK